MGYSLSKMADFQNGLNSRIFGVFGSGFLPKTTVMILQNRFSHVFCIFNFLTQTDILQRLQPLHGLQSLENGRFSKWSHFSNIWCFSEQFFAQNNSNALVESSFACFWNFKFLTQTDQGYSLWKMVDFTNINKRIYWSISRLGFFGDDFFNRKKLKDKF